MDESLMDIFKNLQKEVIKNPASTFYARIKGDALKDEGIEDGDIVIIDKSLIYQNGDLAICVINGSFAIRQVDIRDDGAYLISYSANKEDIRIDNNDEFQIWGIIIYTIKKSRRTNKKATC